MKSVFIISLFLSVLSVSCRLGSPKPPLSPRYGIEHNRVRDSLGIVLVDTDWVVNDVWEGVTVWEPAHSVLHGHLKQVGYFNDTLYCEIDNYRGPETYDLGEDGIWSEHIDVYYFYRPVNTGPWTAFVGRCDRDSMGWMYYYDGRGYYKLTRQETDSMLRAWGYSDFRLGK